MRHQAISVLDGSSFVVSDQHGDVQPDSRLPPHGFFSEDTRFVSEWRLRVQGEPIELLSNAHVDYFVAEFFLVSRSAEFHAAPQLGIIRRRLLGHVWMEDVVVVNHRDEYVPVVLEVEVATDFADLFEVKYDEIPERDIVADAGERRLVFRYRNGAFVRETRITVSEDAVVEQDGMRLDLWLSPREERRVSFVITPHSDQHDRAQISRRRHGSLDEARRERREELDAWLADAPHRDAAARIAAGVVQAAAFFEHRLPEVFAGCDRQLTHAPVGYPTASSPQAWAAAAPLLMLTTVLGLVPTADGPRCDPHLPPEFGDVALLGLPGRWGRADVTAEVSAVKTPAARAAWSRAATACRSGGT